jgi:serine phosphatase RsbU (regulator of sigma subunit)
MGQMRSTLRALAWAADDLPSEQVLRLEEAMTDLGVDGLASLVYARIEDTGDGHRDLRWTNAGHPPPLLVDPDGRARYLDAGSEGQGDVMLGVLPDAARHDHRLDVPDGSLLLLFTDGLVERRDATLGHGLDRLLAAAEAHAALPVGRFLDGVLSDLHDGDLGDDVAMLAVRFR